MKNILILTTLIFGLIFTSLIKNKTRSLEKKLAKLNNEIIILNSNLEEATLDLEYLTTPKNISLLARNFLEEDFTYYKNIQIYDSINEIDKILHSEKLEKHYPFDKLALEKKSNKNLYFIRSSDIKRLSITEEKKEKTINQKKIQRWAGIQVIKAILGFPMLPE